jgi:hypothetical protein
MAWPFTRPLAGMPQKSGNQQADDPSTVLHPCRVQLATRDFLAVVTKGPGPASDAHLGVGAAARRFPISAMCPARGNSGMGSLPRYRWLRFRK